MVRLVDDLLDLSRINSDKLQLQKQPVVLSEVVSQAVETVRPLIAEARHELSIGLPKKNGYEVARQIRQEPWGSNPTLVAITGWGQTEDKDLSRESGFDHHLVKPVDHDHLLNLIQKRKTAQA